MYSDLRWKLGAVTEKGHKLSNQRESQYQTDMS